MDSYTFSPSTDQVNKFNRIMRPHWFTSIVLRFTYLDLCQEMGKRIFIQRRVKPYQASGKTTFSIQGKPGVYLIYKNEQVVYVGYSGTNLYKTMYKHFQKWNDKTQHRVVYSDLSGITVRVVYCNNRYNASRLEKALITKYKPKDNTVTYTIDQVPNASITSEYINEPINPIITSTEALPF